MNYLDLFWMHLINAKDNKITENTDFDGLYYSLENGFSTKASDHDLFKITFTQSGQFQNTIDLFNNRLFLEFDKMPNEFMTYIRLYVPLLIANKLQLLRPFVISHFAQSIDGKICTSSGKSKWISNQENLDHCHRLRAMADGILVGGGTVKADNPQLTVRRVEGKNPNRIFWSNSLDNYTSYKVDGVKTFLIAHTDSYKTVPKGIDCLIKYDDPSSSIKEVLTKLKDLGIHLLFVEGGSHTISKFHEAKMIDLMQIHIAPIIFGSGKNAFEMKPIIEVSDSLQLDGFFSASSDHIMYHGRPIYKE